MKSHFHIYERMSTKTRFEKEAKGNSEMAYWRTLEKCRKHSPPACVFYISLVFSNARHVLSQWLRLLYLLSKTLVYLISEFYCFCHSNIMFISLSQHVMFFLLYGDKISDIDVFIVFLNNPLNKRRKKPIAFNKAGKGGNREVFERCDTQAPSTLYRRNLKTQIGHFGFVVEENSGSGISLSA